MPYRDLRAYLEVLESKGKLKRITAEVDKDWEIAAVCRRVFQRVEQSRRPALFFEKPKNFDIPVLVGALGASREIYALAMECGVGEIAEKWEKAQANPLEPVVVSGGPCKDKIMLGDECNLLSLPVPTWTMGQDAGPYITAPYAVSKDPETGITNVGTYRIQVKGERKAGYQPDYTHCGYKILQKYARQGKPCPVAVVIGSDPAIGLTSVASLPYGVSEYAVAGGLRQQPVELVRCETIDLEVPASAEFVLEGEVLPGEMELEGPFGEYTGYMGQAGQHPVFHVKCITQRNQPIYQAIMSQMPPSESSCIRGLGQEMTMTRYLRSIGLPVVDLHFLEAGGSAAYLAISIRKQYEGQGKQVIWAAWGYDAGLGKITVVVDDDIDIRDEFALNWALSYRLQPAKDVFINDGTPVGRLDPSVAPLDVPEHLAMRIKDGLPVLASKMGIDATKKFAYPAVALPPREKLEEVDKNWARYKLDF